MTPSQRIEAILRGELADKVPFTAFADKLPRSQAERQLRNGGLCLIERRISVFKTVSPSLQQKCIHYSENGASYARTVIDTPAGELSEVEQLGADATSWHVERLFKGPEDYRPLRAMIEDQRYEPDYEEFLRTRERLGEDFFLRPGIGYSPMHCIIYALMGIERFAEEWAERRDEVLALYEVLVENRRRLYPVVAESPALLVNYCGNISPEVVGLKRFEQYYLPHYDEFADLMHACGKLVSVHFDANTWLFEELIGASKIDCIEAFTPPPDCDMSVAHARTVWHDKVLWVNFPGSVQLEPFDRIEATTRQLLREAASGVRFAIGITEDLPPDRWQKNLDAIMRVINAEGLLPLS